MRTAFVIAILLGLAGCQSATFTPYGDTGSRVARSAVIAGVRAELGPVVTLTGLDDDTYTVISADWLLANMDNYRRWAFNYLPGYQGQALDCDNFARILREVIAVQAGRANVPAAPLVAAVYVRQRQTWANVPGDPLATHVISGVVTDRGLYLVEPQSLTTGTPVWCALADYPNPIFHVAF